MNVQTFVWGLFCMTYGMLLVVLVVGARTETATSAFLRETLRR